MSFSAIGHAAEENAYETIINEPAKPKAPAPAPVAAPKTTETKPKANDADKITAAKPVTPPATPQATPADEDNDVYLVRKGQKIGKIPAKDWDKTQDEAKQTEKKEEKTSELVDVKKEESKVVAAKPEVKADIKPVANDNLVPTKTPIDKDNRNNFGKLESSDKIEKKEDKKIEKSNELCAKNAAEYEKLPELKTAFRGKSPFSNWTDIARTYSLTIDKQGKATLLESGSTTPVRKGEAKFCLENKKIVATLFGTKQTLDQYGKIKLNGIEFRSQRTSSGIPVVKPAEGESSL